MQLPDQRLLELEQNIAYEKEVMIVTIQRAIDNWLNESDDYDFLAMEKVSVADLAVFQQLKQVVIFADAEVDAEEFPRLAEWYSEMDAKWTSGQIKGREELEEIKDKLVPAAQEQAAESSAMPFEVKAT